MARHVRDRRRVDALHLSISELRHAFEDDAREPRIIETIPKRGYRLVASVSAAAPIAANAPAASVASVVRAGTKNLEAYQLHVKGRVLLARRGPAVAYVECFERAVRLDPNYAQAWAGLADSYTVLGYSGLVRPQACMPRAMDGVFSTFDVPGGVSTCAWKIR